MDPGRQAREPSGLAAAVVGCALWLVLVGLFLVLAHGCGPEANRTCTVPTSADGCRVVDGTPDPCPPTPAGEHRALTDHRAAGCTDPTAGPSVRASG
ncbi:hypothetical protein ACWEQL_26945 [Kitasatospora sp. NPDC004240]